MNVSLPLLLLIKSNIKIIVARHIILPGNLTKAALIPIFCERQEYYYLPFPWLLSQVFSESTIFIYQQYHLLTFKMKNIPNSHYHLTVYFQTVRFLLSAQALLQF